MDISTSNMNDDGEGTKKVNNFMNHKVYSVSNHPPSPTGYNIPAKLAFQLPSSSIIEVCQPLKRCDREEAIDSQTNASRRDEFTLILISVLTFAFILLEIVGGHLAHSLAIMTDAFHMISDLASFMISILAIHLARRPPTAKYSFGYQRAEVLGALASIIIIWVLTSLLLYMAVERIINQEYEVEANTMMITAGIGVAFNLIIGALLHFSKTSGGHSHFGMPANHKHSHSSSCSSSSSSESNHGGSIEKGLDLEESEHHHSHKHVNLNIRAAFVHVLGDLVQSIGVLIAAVIIKFTGFELADPICTFLFGFLVLMTTMPVLKDALEVLMEATPSHLNLSKVCADLMSIPGVVGVHGLRIWALKLDSTAISVHLNTLTENAVNLNTITAEAHQKLQNVHGFDFITVQVRCQGVSSKSSQLLHEKF